MKKSLLKTLKITSALSLLLGVPLLVVQNKESEKGDAYSTSSLPTTIYLGDADSNKIKEYYESLNSLSTSERQGTNLLKHLKTILKTDQKYYGYPSDLTWNMYEIIDRDWTKSPKESISKSGTYDSSSNSFKNYKYGSSYDNPYVRILYVKRNLDNGARAYGDHSQTSNYGFNREHIWPKSHGFNNEGASNGGALGDPHHLWAGQGHANNIHSNYFYGYVNTSSTYTDCGSSYPTVAGNYRGTSKTIGSGTVFEPQDSDKGDIARAVFYMAARYNSWAGSSSDTFDSCNPNLILSADLSENDRTGSSTSSTKYSLGLVQDLLNWNRIDPPDEYEIHRNNLVYYNYGGNRNPFIDYPEWAEFIWGKSTYNGNTYQSYSSTPTGYATPESDTINGYNGGGSSDPVAVTGVTLNKNSTTIAAGSSETLTATVAPSNATNKAVTWTSSDSNVATVSSSGSVTGVAAGSATITVTTSDGSFTATCTVTITSSGGGGGSSDTYNLYSGSIAEGDYVITYSGDALKNTVTSNRFDYTTVTISNDKISSPDSSLVWHIAPSGNYWSIYNSSVSKYAGSTSAKNQGALLDSISDNAKWTVSGSSTYEFENLARSNGSDSSNKWLRKNGTYGFACYATGTGGALTLYKASSVSPSKVLDSISLNATGVDTEFYVGDSFNYDNLVVTANYTDGTSSTVSPTSVSSPNMSTTGQKTVTVSYTEGGVTKTATYQITVVAAPTKELESISLSGSYPTTFVQNGTFSHEGMTVTANFSDSTNIDVTDSASFTGYNMATLGDQTVTVSYTYEGVTKTATYSITISNESGTSTNPYTVAEARTAIDNASGSTISNKYTLGYIYNVASYSSNYHSITYWISDDGTGSTSSYDGIQVFGGKGIDGADFSAKTELQVGDKVLVSGSLTFYNSTTYEYSSNSSIISLTRMSSLTVSGQTTSYDVGDTFSFDGTATLLYSDNTQKSVTSSVTCSSPDMSSSGTKTITVSYTEYGATVSTTYTITVNSGGSVDPTGETIVLNIEEYATENSWSNGTQYESIKLNDIVTISISESSSGSSNSGKYYTSGHEWRTYQTENATISFEAEEGYTIISIKITYNVGNTGVLLDGSTQVSSDTTVEVNSDSKTFSIGNSGSATNGQVKITNIEIVYSVPVIPVSTSSYSLVKDASELRTGDEIIFVGNYSSTHYNATTISGNYLRAETTTVESDIATKSSNALAFTIEKNGTNYNFYNSNLGYIRNNADQSEAVKTENTVSAYSTFSISINSTSGVSTITASSGNYKYFRFYRNNSTSYWFNFASSSSSYRDVYIYKKTTQVLADEWSQTFLNGTSDGTTCSVSNWSSLASSYKKLAETVQNEIINVDANASTDYSLRAQAMARYDFFMSDSRFNQGEHFIVGRASSSNARPFLSLLATEQNKSLFIVILCSIIGVSSIGCYYFIKFKKREE